MTDARPAEHANELSKNDKTRFCVAFFVFSFAWMLALQIVAAVLLPQRLADIAPDSKDAIFGVLNSATALASLISNLVVGNMSDRTRSIFGRRTPWIASGGIVAGISAVPHRHSAGRREHWHQLLHFHGRSEHDDRTGHRISV